MVTVDHFAHSHMVSSHVGSVKTSVWPPKVSNPENFGALYNTVPVKNCSDGLLHELMG